MIIRTGAGKYMCHHQRFLVEKITKTSWVVHDAAKVTDEEVRQGIFSPYVAVHTSLEDALDNVDMILRVEEREGLEDQVQETRAHGTE